MRKLKLLALALFIVVSFYVADVPIAAGDPSCANKQVNGQVTLESQQDWHKVWPGTPGRNKIRPMTGQEGSMYLNSLQQYFKVGERYPTNTSFMSPELRVFGGGDPQYPGLDDAGLVMELNTAGMPPPVRRAGAFVFEYGEDPDLTNSTITVTVSPWNTSVTTVSFGIVDAAGLIRSWWWSCPFPIPWGSATTITINPAIAGVGATSPVATGFANAPGFNLVTSTSFVLDENFAWLGGPLPVPPPGSTVPDLWNYWHNLIVTNNTPPMPPDVNVASKYYVKWSQRPVPIDPNADPPIFIAWNEISDYNYGPIMADDWLCRDDRPVTDIHWWGSFIGWSQPYPPPVLPRAFHIGIWTDTPDDPLNPDDFSHPAHLVWENYCDNWVWNFAGYDHDPRKPQDPRNPLCEKEADFQFNQLLNQCEWFYQEPNDPNDPYDDPNTAIYWLSIAAIYEPNDYINPDFHPWGWKTRPHFFQDDAVHITGTFNSGTGSIWPPEPPTVCSWWTSGYPLYFPTPADTWDLSFELTTNEPAYRDDPIPGDLDLDGTVAFSDFVIFAGGWLLTATGSGP